MAPMPRRSEVLPRIVVPTFHPRSRPKGRTTMDHSRDLNRAPSRPFPGPDTLVHDAPSGLRNEHRCRAGYRSLTASGETPAPGPETPSPPHDADMRPSRPEVTDSGKVSDPTGGADDRADIDPSEAIW